MVISTSLLAGNCALLYGGKCLMDRKMKCFSCFYCHVCVVTVLRARVHSINEARDTEHGARWGSRHKWNVISVLLTNSKH